MMSTVSAALIGAAYEWLRHILLQCLSFVATFALDSTRTWSSKNESNTHYDEGLVEANQGFAKYETPS